MHVKVECTQSFHVRIVKLLWRTVPIRKGSPSVTVPGSLGLYPKALVVEAEMT